MEKIKNTTSGFTLIETLVAITVLLVALAGPLTIATRGLNTAILARDQVTAFYLAQEAVEYIRNTRDENILLGQDWLTGISVCLSGSSCTIDVPNDLISQCTGSCPALNFDDTTGFYNHQTGDTSRFIRAVSLQAINASEVAVTVAISWHTGVFNRTFSIRENILNWQ